MIPSETEMCAAPVLEFMPVDVNDSKGKSAANPAMTAAGLFPFVVPPQIVDYSGQGGSSTGSGGGGGSLFPLESMEQEYRLREAYANELDAEENVRNFYPKNHPYFRKDGGQIGRQY